MEKKLIWLAVFALTLNSCGIYKKYQPVSQVPDGLYGLPSESDSTGIGQLAWQEIFTDFHLQELIDSALVHNTDMQVAHLRVQQADAALLSARLSYLPAVAFSPQGTVSSLDGGKATQAYTLPVTASWEIDAFGKLTNTKRRSQAAYEQSKEYVQAVRTQLIATVSNYYYTLLMLDAQLEIAVTTEKTWQQSVEATRAMKAAGMVTEAGLSQTEATYYNICTVVLDLKEQINQVENELSLLLANVPGTIKRGKLEEQNFPEQLSVGLPFQMLSNRSDVRMAELSFAQAFYTTNAARSSFYPSITLGGSAGWTNNAGAAITNPGQFLASAVLSLVQPVFDRGHNIAQLRMAKAQQEEARLVFEQTLLNAGNEVNNALTQYQTAQEKSVYFNKQVESLENAVRSTGLLMKHSDTTYLEVLIAQQTLLNARLLQVANRFMEIQGIITLYRALGGG